MAENYRPITIVSCMGKPFTAVLNTRLQMVFENNEILGENQCEFRANYSTCDMFLLYPLLLKFKSKENENILCIYQFSKGC